MNVRSSFPPLTVPTTFLLLKRLAFASLRLAHCCCVQCPESRLTLNRDRIIRGRCHILLCPGRGSTVDVESSRFRGVHACAMLPCTILDRIIYITFIDHTRRVSKRPFHVHRIPTLSKVEFDYLLHAPPKPMQSRKGAYTRTVLCNTASHRSCFGGPHMHRNSEWS